jgi:hypothetical protein
MVVTCCLVVAAFFREFRLYQSFLGVWEVHCVCHLAALRGVCKFCWVQGPCEGASVVPVRSGAEESAGTFDSGWFILGLT